MLFVSAIASDVPEKKYDKHTPPRGPPIYEHGGYTHRGDIVDGRGYGNGYGYGRGNGYGYGYGYGNGVPYGGIDHRIIGRVPQGIYAPSFGIGPVHNIHRTIVSHVIPVPVPVPQAIPVTRNIPVPVPHSVPVEVKRPVPISVPQPVPVVFTKTYPVNVPRPVPVPVPHAVHVPQPVPHPVPISYPIPVPIHTVAPVPIPPQPIPVPIPPQSSIPDPYPVSLPARPIASIQPTDPQAIQPFGPIGFGSIDAGPGVLLEAGHNSGLTISGTIVNGGDFGPGSGPSLQVSVDPGSEGYSYPVPATKFF